MNCIIYKSEIENQIKYYKDFIPLSKDNNSMFRLMREIHRLALLTDTIKEMNFDQLTSEFEFKTIQRDDNNYRK